MVTEQLGADFEFTAYAVENDEFTPVMGFGVENQGKFYVITSQNYAFAYLEDVSWEVNEWYTLKAEISNEEINYYIDEELVYTGNNFSQLDVYGINMLHNNYGGDAYYDNITLVNENLSIASSNKNALVVYPNPVRDIVNIQLPSTTQINHITVRSLTGQTLIDYSSVSKHVDVSALAQGSYILSVNTNKGMYHQKIVKR